MIYQFQFSDLDINQDGCYYLILCKMVEIEKNIRLSERQITELKNYLKGLKVIDGICHVQDPQLVLNALGSRILQVGADNKFWGFADEYDQRYDFVIGEHETIRSEHNILYNNNLKTLYDPMMGQAPIDKEIVRKVYYTIV